MMMQLLPFLDASPTPFHAIETCRSELLRAGFEELFETEPFMVRPGGSYFVARPDGALFAFRAPQAVGEQLNLFYAHSDSPALRLKATPTVERGDFSLLNCEVYGSPVLNSWLDRDLALGGLVYYRAGGKNKTLQNRPLQKILVRSEPVFTIPRLAVHLSRESGQDGKINPVQLTPLACQDLFFFDEWLAGLLPGAGKGVEVDAFDLLCFDPTPARRMALDGSLVSSGRIDNLAMVHAGLSALVRAKNQKHRWNGVFVFHNEEVGSVSYAGAASNFARSMLERTVGQFHKGEAFHALLARSFALSADMAHAQHPLFHGVLDGDAPVLGGGPVLKTSAARRYASEAAGAARFKGLCARARVPMQVFAPKNDMPCGSTVGPTLAANLGIQTVDVGSPMLAMHSIREIASLEDHEMMGRVVDALFTARP